MRVRPGMPWPAWERHSPEWPLAPPVGGVFLVRPPVSAFVPWCLRSSVHLLHVHDRQLDAAEDTKVQAWLRAKHAIAP